MEQAQASSSDSDAREKSAQNPTPPSSSAATTATASSSQPEDVAVNGLHTQTLEQSRASEESICPEKINDLPSLPEDSNSNAKVSSNAELYAAENLVNTSPWTNLSRHSVTNEMVFGPIPDREYHEGFMRKAIEMAQLALASDETPVGCVFVRDGEVIGRGINGTNASLNGTRHAEFVALCEIMSRHHPSVLHTTDLYVTVEPCIMCASALRQYGIRSVYFGCLNDRFGGTGGVMTVHMDEGVDAPYPVYGGLFREEAIMLLRRFYVQENDKAPEPKPKKNRELKTEILPVGVPSGGNTPANLISPAAATTVVATPATETPIS